jgi:ubiquinone/menaquinone biosynthesis C-methylase UbiE
MVHKYDVSNRNKLDNPERMRLLAPYETLAKLGYKKGDMMADIGCGTGLFTIPAAEISGGQAKTYAIDVSEEMLTEVEKRTENAGFHNVKTVKSDEYDFKFDDEAVDFVLICAVLHEIDNQKRFILEVQRVCRPGGTVAVIEFNESATIVGPPLSDRLTRSLVAELLTGAGFINASEKDISEAFYAVTANKQYI